MEVRLPKSWHSLPQSEKDKINEAMTRKVVKQVCHEQAQLQKIWLQMACIVLNRNFGFGRKRLLIFLGVWREMYRINTKLGNEAEQTAYLTAEINRIFGKDGYPSEFIDKLEEL